jgi:hypothetical protein
VDFIVATFSLIMGQRCGGLATITFCSRKVRTEWSLTTLAYNLKRVLNLVSFEKLMAAVGVKVPQSV